MGDDNSIEQRLANLEAVVAEIQRKLAEAAPPPKPWTETMRGSMADLLPEFDEIVKLGREIRQADRPPSS